MRGVAYAVAGNLLIMGAGVVTLVWLSPRPDIVVGIVIGAINVKAAAEVSEQARAEDPELVLPPPLLHLKGKISSVYRPPKKSSTSISRG